MILIVRKILFKILDWSFIARKFLQKHFTKFDNPNLRVLIYHDVKSEKQINLFKNQILSLRRNYEFISPDEFESYVYNGSNNGGKILLTFDDGFKSNRKLAEEVLNEMNIKALFFIVSDFLGEKKESQKYKSIINNIYPKGPTRFELSDPMDKKDIEFLLSTGHKIGCHTFSHKMLSTINSRSELNKELIKSKLNLEKEFGIKINHFAFPFGTFKSINKNSLEILNQNFDFIHSGLRGNNKNIKNNKLVFRDAVNPEMGITRLKSFLIGNADFLYIGKYNKLKKYLI